MRKTGFCCTLPQNGITTRQIQERVTGPRALRPPIRFSRVGQVTGALELTSDPDALPEWNEDRGDYVIRQVRRGQDCRGFTVPDEFL